MKPAVLIIDVQAILFDPLPQPFESHRVIEKINRLTTWARQHEFPVFWIQHEQPQSAIEYGSTGWNLQADLQLEATDYQVRKTTPDAFLQTDLKLQLEQASVDELIICGYATEFCIDTTVRRAASLGYPVTVVGDAHTTHDKPHLSAELIRAHHNATLPEITSFGVSLRVISTDKLIADGLSG